MNSKRLSMIVLVLVLVMTLGASLVQAQAAKVIKIASASPLSGGQSQLGIGIRNATELAIEELGGSLRDMGFDLQFVPFDDQATPDVGVANAQQMVADAAILGVVGHLNSGVAIPSSEVYNQNNLVMVSPANTNVLITDRELPTVNRVCGRDDAQGAVGAQFAVERGYTTAYVLNDTTAYGLGVASFFRDNIEAAGITVLGFEGTEETSNFEGIIQPILALSPDVVYFGGIYNQIGVFVNQLYAAGYTGEFLGPDGLDAPDFAELAGTAVVGVHYTSAGGPVSAFPNSAAFVDSYTEKFGEPPVTYGAESYDSTGIILAAIERAVEAAGGEIPTREAVAAEVRATTEYDGLTGMITFDDHGDRELANFFIFEVASADPAEWGNNTVISQIQIPSPLYAAEEASS
ncbi:MAG: branched-chain amino acid ABC transporter substrate-binding protein [Anaerolineae bacterium]|nr:branched-chain amino acid ABC transporter substrate-binding protein [Anaerolineae bacterium]